MDYEMEVADYLNGSGIGFAAYYEVPSDRPGEFAVVELAGGQDENRVQSVRVFNIWCYAMGRPSAARAADAVRRSLMRMPDVVENAFRCRINSVARDPQIDDGQHSYVVTAEIYFNE